MRRAGRVLHIAVAARLIQFVRTQSRAGHRRVRLDGIALVEEAFLVQLLQQVPQRLDILVVVGDIRVLEVNPVTHLLGQVRPLLGVFHHLLAARGVVLIHANLLAYILLGDAQFLLHAEFHGQTVGVPTGLTLHLIALHRFVTAERVLDCTCQHMMDTRHAVGRRRAFEEQERFVAFTHGYTLMKEVFFLPLLQHLTAHSRQIQLLVFSKMFHLCGLI